MGHKIFVSYKYADSDVKNLTWFQNSTVRDYVTEFQDKLSEEDDIYKGESDDEDLSDLSDDTIWEKLKNRIYDSSVTVIFISPNMKDDDEEDRNQWIPWEIAYSLKEISRKTKTGKNITSRSNAMVAVVLPDSYGSYDYYLEDKSCCSSKCTMHYINKLFDIMKNNKFNLKKPSTRECDNGDVIWTSSNPSYIGVVRWKDFISDYKKYIDEAIVRQEKIDDYKICKEV